MAIAVIAAAALAVVVFAAAAFPFFVAAFMIFVMMVATAALFTIVMVVMAASTTMVADANQNVLALGIKDDVAHLFLVFLGNRYAKALDLHDSRGIRLFADIEVHRHLAIHLFA